MPIVIGNEGILSRVREIDTQLVGGIRAGSLVLLEGSPDSGKSTLSQHFTHAALLKNTNSVVYYTTDYDVKGLIKQMDTFGMPALNYLLADNFRIYPMRSPITPREALKAGYLLTNHIAGLPERFNIMVIDSITPYIAKLNPAHKADFFRACKKLCGKNRIIILTAHPHIFEKKTVSRVTVACDYHFLLEIKTLRFQPDQREERIVRKMRVLKLHGAEVNREDGIRFIIVSGVGIESVPFSKFSI